MYFDSTYLLFIVPALIVSALAQLMVTVRFNKYSSKSVSSGITGAMAARRVLDEHGLSAVRIERISGNLTDHYDPRDNVLRLSEKVYSSSSQAAIGVACHEAGHAIQDSEDYLPAKIRLAIIPATNIGSKLGVILIPVGFLIAAFTESFILTYIGLIAYSMCAVFQLVTLPTEFNASRRAMQSIERFGFLTHDEKKGARKVLTAAALTYVAALFTVIMTILRYLALISRMSGRRND